MIAIYKKIICLMMVLIIFIIVLSYLKIIMLYHPVSVNPEKYDRFYQKLLKMTDHNDYVSNISVPTNDGYLLDTFYIRNPNSDKCIIIFHGNSGNIAMRFEIIKFLYNYSSIIIFDYRSYGKSTGEISHLSCGSLKKDADAIWNYVTNYLGYPPNSISLFGESLGCSLAIYLTMELSKTMDPQNYPNSLILNSPFYSLSSMIELIFEKINVQFIGSLLSYFIGFEYQSNEWIKFVNYHTKILIAHSRKDEVIPYTEGQKLYAEIYQTHQNSQFISITGTHNNPALTDQYIYALAEIFDE